MILLLMTLSWERMAAWIFEIPAPCCGGVQIEPMHTNAIKSEKEGECRVANALSNWSLGSFIYASLAVSCAAADARAMLSFPVGPLACRVRDEHNGVNWQLSMKKGLDSSRWFCVIALGAATHDRREALAASCVKFNEIFARHFMN